MHTLPDDALIERNVLRVFILYLDAKFTPSKCLIKFFTYHHLLNRIGVKNNVSLPSLMIRTSQQLLSDIFMYHSFRRGHKGVSSDVTSEYFKPAIFQLLVAG